MINRILMKYLEGQSIQFNSIQIIQENEHLFHSDVGMCVRW